MITQFLSKGSLSITENVFAVITSICINDIEEIDGTVYDVKEQLYLFLNNGQRQKGILIKNEKNDIIIDIHVCVKYGVNIAQVCKKLQALVVTEIGALTGIRPTAINVMVDEIQVKNA
ncbi:Asp23/Gls24 family envelope stress response protein [Bacillus sp. SCS-151]|uniref:Asp23/Gls24 family envelope stress response protein n=1 Tax=Nanhaiella sioensis TaxID=3115293 RepID=UPI00397A0F2F